MLDSHRLNIFLKLAELNSFSHTAWALYLTQPTISQHISALENTLGTSLFDRRGKEIQLTRAGEILYRYARQIYILSEEALQSLELLKGKKGGTVIVGASTIPGEYVLPAIIGQFKDHYPGIKIILKISDTAKIAKDLLDFKIDIGVIGAKTGHKNIRFSRFLDDRLVLIVPRKHPWWKRHFVEPADLLSEPFVLREPGSGSRTTIEKEFDHYNINIEQLNVAAETGSTTAVKQAVKANLGISIVSELAVKEEIKLKILKEVRIKNMEFLRTFFIIQFKNRNLSPTCKTFLDFLFSRKHHHTPA
jgi:DNA-binding transcriptional LysR family regulator